MFLDSMFGLLRSLCNLLIHQHRWKVQHEVKTRHGPGYIFVPLREHLVAEQEEPPRVGLG
jgi:hypothetical protein